MLVDRKISDSITDRNIAAVFFARAKQLDHLNCVEYKEKKEPYRSMNWREFSKLVQQIALGLMTLGLKAGEKAAIFSSTTHYWVAADLATISNGAISVPVYPTSSANDIDFIINNSQAKVLFVQNENLLKRALAVRDSIPTIQKIVLFFLPSDVKSVDELAVKYNLPNGLLADIESVRKLGASLDTAHLKILEDRMKSTPKDGIATIIYTSGTTGVPKGVPLTHGNIMAVIEDMKPVLSEDDRSVYLSYLPLSHIFERICGEFYWLAHGGVCAFAESIEMMGRNMIEVEPTTILVVPRVLDRIYAKVKSGIDGATGKKRKLIDWGLDVGAEVVECHSEGKKVGPLLWLKHKIADKLVLEKLRERIGPNLKIIVSGGAPATREVLTFFNAVGINTLEGYGLTETSAPTNVNRIGRVKIGTVGPVVDSVHQKLAEDGEILVKGPTIFKGYYNNPEATAEAFEGEWFKTGDIGTIDADGYLKITDRKKDLIINSAGKNIAPQRVEAVLKTVPFVTQAVVFGDKQKHLVALITLDEQAACDFARERNWEFDSYFDLSRSTALLGFLKKELQARSKDLADYEQVKRFAILANELSVEAGELTATLKIKRNVVGRNYKSLIDQMYSSQDTVAAEHESRELAGLAK